MPSSDETAGRRRCSEDEANEWFRQNADAELVDAFWAGERPARWPDSIPFPVEVVVLPKDWVRSRRFELGLTDKPS